MKNKNKKKKKQIIMQMCLICKTPTDSKGYCRNGACASKN